MKTRVQGNHVVIAAQLFITMVEKGLNGAMERRAFRHRFNSFLRRQESRFLDLEQLSDFANEDARKLSARARERLFVCILKLFDQQMTVLKAAEIELKR